MRAGLLYIVFLTLAFLLVDSKQTDNKHLRNDISAGRSVAANEYIACIVPAFNLSLKKIYTEPVCFKPLFKRLLKDNNGSRIDLTTFSVRLYQTKSIGFKPLIKRPFLLTLHHSAEKEDDHLLS
jgi:hypothetical protein